MYLNEVVVSRGEIIRPVILTAYVDHRFLTTYVADGLIAATPTGSTAYALAAGDQSFPPELRNILLVPVAPHLSIDRAIILAEGSSVTITVQTDHQAVLSIDGQAPVKMIRTIEWRYAQGKLPSNSFASRIRVTFIEILRLI
jgi:NAD+ kinase